MLLAMDIETVPDPVQGRRHYGLNGTDEEVSRAMLAARLDETAKWDRPTDFLKPHMHRIVALGMSVFTDAGTVRRKAWCNAEEDHLIGCFTNALVTRPTLYTVNGNSFDLPVIRARSLMHGLAMGALELPAEKQWEKYLPRYTDRHVDLADNLSGFGACPRMSLAEMCELLGFPGKTEDGAHVLDMWYTGEHERIRRYVARDAALTLAVALQFEGVRETLDRDLAAKAIEQLIHEPVFEPEEAPTC